MLLGKLEGTTDVGSSVLVIFKEAIEVRLRGNCIYVGCEVNRWSDGEPSGVSCGPDPLF